MPKILKGYKTLKTDGQISDALVETQLKPMVMALQSYGSINRLSEAPDKISRKLLKDVSAFKDCCKARDYPKAMEMLEQFKSDIPAGVGEFSWDSTLPTDLQG